MNLLSCFMCHLLIKVLGNICTSQASVHVFHGLVMNVSANGPWIKSHVTVINKMELRSSVQSI